MANVGPFPGSVEVLGANWGGTGTTFLLDTLPRSAALDEGVTQTPLIIKGFGFSVPAGENILGVDVPDFLHRTQLTQGTAALGSVEVRITKDGTSPASAARTVPLPAPGPYQNAPLGNSTDMFGTTLTRAQVNAATFGLYIQIVLGGSAFGETVPLIEQYDLDYVRVRVYHTTGGGGGGSPVGCIEREIIVPPIFTTWEM